MLDRRPFRAVRPYKRCRLDRFPRCARGGIQPGRGRRAEPEAGKESEHEQRTVPLDRRSRIGFFPGLSPRAPVPSPSERDAGTLLETPARRDPSGPRIDSCLTGLTLPETQAHPRNPYHHSSLHHERWIDRARQRLAALANCKYGSIREFFRVSRATLAGRGRRRGAPRRNRNGVLGAQREERWSESPSPPSLPPATSPGEVPARGRAASPADTLESRTARQGRHTRHGRLHRQRGTAARTACRLRVPRTQKPRSPPIRTEHPEVVLLEGAELPRRLDSPCDA